jgi:serine phosphatase RsbU (regulator of sigma subunit)
MLDADKCLAMLEMAGAAQRAMLPAAPPVVPGYSFWAHWEAALGACGDLYDHRPLPTGESLIVVGDVAGKGLPAALIAFSVPLRLCGE